MHKKESLILIIYTLLYIVLCETAANEQVIFTVLPGGYDIFVDVLVVKNCIFLFFFSSSAFSSSFVDPVLSH